MCEELLDLHPTLAKQVQSSRWRSRVASGRKNLDKMSTTQLPTEPLLGGTVHHPSSPRDQGLCRCQQSPHSSLPLA